jgi:hypothetical protein
VHLGLYIWRVWRVKFTGDLVALRARATRGCARLWRRLPRRERLSAQTFPEASARDYLNRRARKSEKPRFAGTSKRLKGLEPSTFCMLVMSMVVSQISSHYAGVLSTNCPPKRDADLAAEALP